MCGIFGSVNLGRETYDVEGISRALAHRGPDNTGVLFEDSVTLGQCRLSILDIDDRSNQPMVSSCGRYVLAYNGEIYNFRELKKELAATGTKFLTNSDTEVLLEGLALRGIEFIKRLNGMFAFSFFDREEQKVFLARDRFGIKPLYFSLIDGCLVFGSEIKSILKSGVVPDDIAYRGVAEYMHFSSTLGETSFYKYIKKLTPGCIAEFDLHSANLAVSAYWEPSSIEKRNIGSQEAIQEISARFKQSVRRQLVADVPVGIFLSGGVDSAAITSVAAEHYAGKLKTFTASFEFDNGKSELEQASKIAKYYDTDHQELMVQAHDIPSVLETLNSYFDQPFGDAANIPLYLMGKEITGTQKVILQGDGGDELFGGYPRYSRVYHERLFKCVSFIFRMANHVSQGKIANDRRFRTLLALSGERAEVPGRFYSSEVYGTDIADYFSAEFAENLRDVDSFARHRGIFEECSDASLLDQLLYSDFLTILPDQYLEKVDRATMANSLEVRVPFLDNDLAEYALSLDGELRIKGGRKKYLLKKALENIVPPFVLNAPKRGFGVPFQNWLRGPMKDYMFDVIGSCEVINPSVSVMMNEHALGKREHGFTLWKLLNFAQWYERRHG